MIVIVKLIGQTPLQAINNFKKLHPRYKNKKIAYAGRLDPLARGVLLLLVGDETKNAEKYQNLDKTYEFECLFGITTDTYDILGKIQNSKLDVQNPNKQHFHTLKVESLKGVLEKKISGLVGKHRWEYPPYSSKAVGGKPLFWWARKNKLNEIVIPKRIIEIYSVKLTGIYKISTNKLLRDVAHKIELVNGNFRQKEIVSLWKTSLRKSKIRNFSVAKITLDCTSGTYIRTICHLLGKKMGTGAITFDINRTRVGNYLASEALKI